MKHSDKERGLKNNNDIQEHTPSQPIPIPIPTTTQTTSQTPRSVYSTPVEPTFMNTTSSTNVDHFKEIYDISYEKNVLEVCSRLNLLALIKPGDKLDPVNMRIQTDWWFTKLTRTYYHTDRNRTRTLDVLTKLFNDAMDLIVKYYHSPDTYPLGDLIVENIVKARKGVDNMKQTYEDDSTFLSKLTTILSLIDVRFEKIKNDKNNTPR
jgi:hypothetical protein